MTTLVKCVFVITLVNLFTPGMDSARILAVLPHVGKSHYFVFEPYLKALAKRGHEITVVSHFPQKQPLQNYKDISIKGTESAFTPTNGINFKTFSFGPSVITSVFFTEHLLSSLGTLTCENGLSHPAVQELLKSDQKFDLIVTELFVADCFLGFVHKFPAPHIALSSCGLMPWASKRFANPTNPSYIPNIFGSFSDRMTFAERLENTLYYFYSEFAYYFLQYLPSQRIAEQYFGASMPSLEEIAQNTSLILVNTFPDLNRPRPLTPNVIEIGGIHVEAPNKLQKDLDTWMSEASHGVVFFSMGSMLRVDTLSDVKIAALLAAFRELPQRILWKWEGDTLPGQPDNVRVAKWLPQRDILAHKNVVLFMTHCGLLSSIEAAQSGVPMIGSPIYGDQKTNFRAVEAAGVAVRLDFQSEFTKQDVLDTIRTVLDNKTYSENAARLSRQFLDRPSSPMDTAIFWTEYVIRHKGAQHLRSAAVDLTWYQYLLLDVLLATAAAIIAIICVLTFTVKKLTHLARSLSGKQKQQ